MKKTIVDIAKEANVSVTTVSFVLNNKADSVSKETAKRIRDIANKYHYVPNHFAIGLVTKKTKTIGLIVPDISNNFFSELAKSVEHYCNNSGYSLVLSNTNNQPEKDFEMVDLLNNRGIDGLLIAFSQTEDYPERERFLNALKQIETPIVAVDSKIEGIDLPGVSIDHVKGGYIATKHLIDLNHRRIGCITGPAHSYTAIRRLKGYRNALSEKNISYDENLVIAGNYRYQDGYEAAKKLLRMNVTAIFASNDLMAYGVYRAAQEAGKSIPGELSVIGFDDLVFSEIMTVPLTTVHQSVEELGKKAWELLFGRISSEESGADYIELEPTLVKRSSTALRKDETGK